MMTLALGLAGHGRADVFSVDQIKPLDTDFQFPVFTAPGIHALAAWETLKQEHQGVAWPVVMGSAQDFEYFREGFEHGITRPPNEILATASGLEFPLGFKKAKIEVLKILQKEMENLPHDQAFLRMLGWDIPKGYNFDDMLNDQYSLDEWPSEEIDKDGLVTLSVAHDWETDKPLDQVLIALIPTADWTEVPAYLNYGGWNDCPEPKWHVAAFKHWKEAYNCELVGLSYDTFNIRVGKRPQTKEQALNLAVDQNWYCGDLTSQIMGDVPSLAQALKASDWWLFWWD